MRIDKYFYRFYSNILTIKSKKKDKIAEDNLSIKHCCIRSNNRKNIIKKKSHVVHTPHFHKWQMGKEKINSEII